ncbi:helix-turn-helix transcriptional regulator [Streptomyces sp. SID11385]|uniref:helix-turn-helix domain-containing protein n=1 Tax=Streptomyces sp. SID11385 TaxID=2706031 RepID=UPI0013C83138|nr:helix-turn-helix transcriptional regulator [Streptomyces sp. SID11385]NEA39881.1 helix-turn-helix transcriptional regulator [Streptomyces sp. SID11385]
MDARREHGEEGALDRSLPELLRSWRKRLSPRDFPGLRAQGRRATGLTQRDVARLIDVSERWYGALERGKKAGYSAEVLDRLASALRLSRPERQALYMKTVGHPPALPGAPEAPAATEADGALLQRFLDQQANPAYATDLAWNIVGANEPLLQWFPWAAYQGNQMRWALLEPEAREQLVDWETTWAHLYLGQIRYERARYPHNESLARLEQEVRAGSPFVRAIWDQGEVVEHTDGRVARLRLPYHQGREVAVRIISMRPMHTDLLRVTVLMREGEDA